MLSDDRDFVRNLFLTEVYYKAKKRLYKQWTALGYFSRLMYVIEWPV